MARKQDYIAVFDSGVGGISVLRRLMEELPNERYLYFGDSANAPYGVRSEAQIRELTLAVAKRLYSRGIKALVIACNTATSAAYEAVCREFPGLSVVGIEPALDQAAQAFPGGHIGVLATPRTLRGSRFLENKARWDGKCRVTPLPAPGLMELVEQGKYNSPEADALLTKLLPKDLDALVLGCTHYPFGENSIRRVLGEDVPLFDGAVVTAQRTRQALAGQGLLYEGPGQVQIENGMGQEMTELSWRLLQWKTF